MNGKIKFENLTFEEAVKYFKDKFGLKSDEYYKMVNEYRTLAFTVSYVKNIEAVQGMQELVKNAIKEGTTFADFRKDVVEKVGSKNFEKLMDWHLRTVFLTNITTSYQVGRYHQLQAVKKMRPYWQYHHSGSTNPRPSHLALDGQIFAADDPIWDTIFAPNGFNCFCSQSSLSEMEMDEEGLWNNYEKNKNKKVKKGYIDKLKADITSEKEKGFLVNPAKKRYKPDMNNYPEWIRKKYRKNLKEEKKKDIKY